MHDYHITDSTHLQYLSVNTSIVIFSFKNYCHVIIQPHTDEYKEWNENESSDKFAKNVRNCSKLNSICPFHLQQANSDVFLTYLLSFKKSNNAYFSFSCMMANDQHLSILQPSLTKFKMKAIKKLCQKL